MKRVFWRIAIAVILPLTVLVTACSKEGPAGDKGEQGEQGEQGEKGEQGDPGTANIIYSNWLDVAYLPDKNQSGDTLGYYTEIDAPKLTNDILSKGEIRVYVNVGSSTSMAVFPIPYFSIYNLININPTFFAGSIELYANEDVGTYEDSGEKFQQYRYILIPGGVPARSAINWNDYESVKKYLELKD